MSDDALANVSAVSEWTAHPRSFVSGRSALRIARNGGDSVRVSRRTVFTIVSISLCFSVAQEGDYNLRKRVIVEVEFFVYC